MAFRYTRYNKFKAKRTEYAGRIYHSRREAQYAQELDLLKKAGEIREWEAQPAFDLSAYGKKICRYYCDFEIIHPDGSIEYVDVKGYQTKDFRIKWKMFLAYLARYRPDAVATIKK